MKDELHECKTWTWITLISLPDTDNCVYINSHLMSLAISSSESRLLFSMNMRKSTMATSPTTDPRVVAAIMPALEAGRHNTDRI